MSFIDYQGKQIICKVVFYGPVGAGKSAMLRHIFEATGGKEMETLPSESPNPVYYDCLPLRLGQIRGFTTQLNLFTVPGAEGYTDVRKRLLEGVDGLVFVADARPAAHGVNALMLAELKENLRALGFTLHALPFIIVCTHVDQPGALSGREVTEGLLRTQPELAGAASFAVVPTQGQGVFEALKAISRLILIELKRGG
jgi:signal recognition particle receptor subunit beta